MPAVETLDISVEDEEIVDFTVKRNADYSK